MEWTALIWGVALAAVVLVPLAIKWQLPFGVVGPWLLVIGAASGIVWQALIGGPSVAWALAVLFTVIALSAAAAAFAFFRDPQRTPPPVAGALVSPADGRVVYIRPITGGEVPPV